MRAKRRGVKVISQRKGWDCGVASLAMLTGKPYGDVMALARANVSEQKRKRYGLVTYELEDIAMQLGQPLKRIYRRRDYLFGQTGILGLLGGAMDKRGHWVILKAGAIVDPDGGEVWAVDDYLKRYKARPCTLLVAA